MEINIKEYKEALTKIYIAKNSLFILMALNPSTEPLLKDVLGEINEGLTALSRIEEELGGR